MLNLLLKPLTDIVGTSVKGFIDNKKAKTELKLTEIKAAKKRMEDIAAGKISWEQSAVDQMQHSWKDEFWTLIFGAILLGCFLPWTQEYVKNGFIFLDEHTPSWFHNMLYIVIGSSFGYRFGKQGLQLINKKKQ